ncbi:HD domain-containing protein [Prolixibacteraceae bacterium Z1-6]|uniref:HD domain-containing protein n=1 Tax=Draconibacterium aestuarii TaxID=2998507 RepID=A0A9X3F846_9BACT|nr:HD domain-containing protein [Prolixibacteraceae bacterium Z1-6]
MNEINTNLIDQASRYVSNILDEELPANCVWHTKDHTFDVLKNVELIGNYYNLNENDLNILRLAALFHDVGYVKLYSDHELQSAEIAATFLNSKGIPDSDVTLIKTSILATKVPQQPKDLFSKILCDADLMHLSYENYFEQIEYMREEWNLTGQVSYTEKEFHVNSLHFFYAHSYHTRYGRLILEPKKKMNRERIKNRIAEL